MTSADSESLPGGLAGIFEFLAKLERGHLHYDLASKRLNALMVIVSVPGERWEVEFMADGLLEVERFRSDGNILDAEALVDL
jgi:hypothetical protein